MADRLDNCLDVAKASKKAALKGYYLVVWKVGIEVAVTGSGKVAPRVYKVLVFL